VKCNNGKRGKKDFSDYCSAEKACIFSAIRYCGKMYGKAMPKIKAEKG
jgi:hypothetical protein